VPTSSASPSPDANLKRRRFLFALGASSAATAAAATQAIAAPVAAVTPAATQETSSGYRETEHVRDYYASTRI
jgi:nitrous oxide reductase